MKQNFRLFFCWAAITVILLSSTLTPAYAFEPKDQNYYERFQGKGISISVYNWGEYICNGGDGLMNVNEEFTKLTDIKVNYTNYATNEELYAKMKSGGSNYDVIFPSDYMIARMMKENMLAPLNHENIPNASYINPLFHDNSYDPGNVYSIPYTWGTVVIIYNKNKIKEPIESWQVLWDERYKNEILMFSNSRDAFGIALKALGYSLNSEDPKELREATDLLKEQKPFVQSYVMDQIFDKMEANEAMIAPYYAGDAISMMESNEDLAVAFPKEGTNLFVDAVCIPANSDNQEAAEMYINFLNEPKVAADNIEYIGYSSPNLAAFDLLDEEIQNNEIIYPSMEILEQSEQFINLSDETNLRMDQLWTEVLASKGSFLSWGFAPVVTILALFATKNWMKYNRRKKRKRMVDE
ncbi:ABC transporter substrate-binding protein [Anaerovorax sp. IOR16]|uniref:ABC transporter substrate-binding protein n=1 Tax=Anaerovorax sp. IOR16 TaxID=2773458 RepID=UPI0019CF6627|nr:spermidine/putrescine ABC transporter substrate-binding protein [Anaerovorax sp. IOR16]